MTWGKSIFEESKWDYKEQKPPPMINFNQSEVFVFILLVDSERKKHVMCCQSVMLIIWWPLPISCGPVFLCFSARSWMGSREDSCRKPFKCRQNTKEKAAFHWRVTASRSNQDKGMQGAPASDHSPESGVGDGGNHLQVFVVSSVVDADLNGEVVVLQSNLQHASQQRAIPIHVNMRLALCTGHVHHPRARETGWPF